MFDSFQLARQLGRSYACVGDLLASLAVTNFENTYGIMKANSLTLPRIVGALEDIHGVHPSLTTPLVGVQQDYQVLLVSLDMESELYPGLPRQEKPISCLDLLYNSIMWTKDSAADVVGKIGTNPDAVVRACRLRQLYLDLRSQG